MSQTEPPLVSPTRKHRWLQYSLGTMLLIVLLASIGVWVAVQMPQRQVAAQLAVAVVAILPQDWTCQRSGRDIVLRRKESPVFVNVMQQHGPERGESEDHYLRRHVVKFDYRITLSVREQLAPGQVQGMIEENAPVRREMKRCYGDESEYRRLETSLHPIPDGHYAGLAVYVQPTDLGAASFLSDATRDECETLRKRLVGLLEPYPEKQTSTDNEQ